MAVNDHALIIGAGFAGAVAARELAERGGMRVLLLERRPHIAGNAYDCPDDAGILIHKYGPHIFHTADRRVWEWLSRYTDWREYEHRVLASVRGDFMPVPFNLTSLHMAFPGEKGARLERKLLETYGEGARVTILTLRGNTDPELREVADYVYENVFVHYTMKQWGQTPEEIDPATTARVPVLLSRDDRYFQDPFQGMPLEGYTPIFQRILDHPNITVELETDADSRLRLENGRMWLDGALFDGPVIYTGQADALFGFRYGPLPYRTLDFRFETLPMDRFQPAATVNYTVSEEYTRITEFKQLTGQACPGRTTIMKEYSRAYAGGDDIPYYAIISPENNELYGRYLSLAGEYQKLHLLGRLAEYKYYNMDAIVGRALALCDGLLKQERIL